MLSGRFQPPGAEQPAPVFQQQPGMQPRPPTQIVRQSRQEVTFGIA